MLAMRDRPRFDAIPVAGTGIDELDQRLVRAFTDSARAASRRLSALDDATVLRRKGVIDHHSDQVTVGGLYALGDYPQQFAPSLSVTAAVVTEPGVPNRLVDLAHFDGPIPDLLTASLDWLQRNMHTGIQVRPDGHNINRPEFPIGALREFVANALVHRDLSPHTQSKQVEIRLRPDRLVISSPGGLWGVSREQLGTPGAKSSVNEYLYEICRHISTATGARVIEGEGGGIREAERELRDWGLAPPIFVDKAVSFTVVLMRPDMTAGGGPGVGAVSGAGEPRERVLAALQRGALDRKEIINQTGLTRAQVRYALEKLVQGGHVVMLGGLGDRNTTYALVGIAAS